MPQQLLKRLFTVKEYHLMVNAGILKEDDRVELIKGEIIQMSPIGRFHAACVDRLIELFILRLGSLVNVRGQNPVELNDNSEPQPDLALLRRRADFYESGHPQTQDILLIIEVADTTVESDREVKIPLYAASGIVEVWLVNIPAECIEVYRQPSANGYQSVQIFQRGQSIFIEAFPDVSFTVDEILG
ncbi:Uma2 family endonuclease [Planktothrix sp. FACHB-1355]|uniref:Uma2 family endonuclease n=1 Tax=Aerosakkonema funiforme FACHB-1375 TaxID=2949571 RepID=A0A926VHB3_9CYAN|nr:MULTISPECIES: Uma2 family endonuclease [Oscillatoriales]MBD2182639.1 Uma2 family endonuclease [Aerosakkonema funiforme FACHB-1375]MBD3561129.1 Uma2 family endonuclease [Planktothrix sp. FACHB-1355]